MDQDELEQHKGHRLKWSKVGWNEKRKEWGQWRAVEGDEGGQIEAEHFEVGSGKVNRDEAEQGGVDMWSGTAWRGQTLHGPALNLHT